MMKTLNVVCYGGGVDSTAMIIQMHILKMHIDLIIFADTGGEKPHTYKYINLFDDWLKKNELPSITIVKSHLLPLYDDCINNKCLPSVAYGFKSCSDKWKIRPSDKYLKENYSNFNIIKYIGIDADEAHRAIESPRKWYKNKYPLVELEISRDNCLAIIKNSGLTIPRKSACYFCPSSKISEIKELQIRYPDLANKCIEMEKNADLNSIKGLGRSFSWTNLLLTNDMFIDSNIDINCNCYDG